MGLEIKSGGKRPPANNFVRADVWSFCNFGGPATGFSSTGGGLLYAFRLDVYDGDLDRQKSPLSDGTDLHDLINEDLPYSMSFLLRKG